MKPVLERHPQPADEAARPMAEPPVLDPGEGLTERFVTLPDGRRLRSVLSGTGAGPLVVFEAGMSAPAASWVHTQREIGARHRTLSYDRAGYGGSDADPQPRSLARIVEDLTALLDALGETSPVVLVGHSWGGPILRLFASEHPERVAGLVFVDSSVVECMPQHGTWMVAGSFRAMAALARLGGKKAILRLSLPVGASPEITDQEMDIMARDYACARAMRAGAREAAQIGPSLALLRELQAAGTPDVPTVSLQGGRIDRGMKKTRPLLNQTATSLMAAVPNGRVVVVPEAGHLIPQESPGIVRDTILGLVDTVTQVQR